MKTDEHIKAGDGIWVDGMMNFHNPYLHCSDNTAYAKLEGIEMMRLDDDGIPQVLDTTLSPGEIVALAGDYFTKAGWASCFQMPDKHASEFEQRKYVIGQPITEDEALAFKQAYDDLANNRVTNKKADGIIDADDTSSKWTKRLQNALPFASALISLGSTLATQAYFALTVNQYKEKLVNNEAHFAKWATRAYIIGHHHALAYATMARALAAEEITDPKALALCAKAITKQQFKGKCDKEIAAELSLRFHAMAVAKDCFAMHFYSDHYAGGHMGRLGWMRKVLPEKFGLWGSILVNTMHDIDNKFGVVADNPNQVNEYVSPDEVKKDAFIYPNSDDKAFGDGSYLSNDNARNREELINGMTNSLGDIQRVMNGEPKPCAFEFGGLAFLPAVNYAHKQLQPMLVEAADGKIFYLKNIDKIKIIEPQVYEALRKNPKNNPDYQELTKWRAFKLTLKLRGLSVIPGLGKKFTPAVVSDEKSTKGKLQRSSSLSYIAKALGVKKHSESVTPVCQAKHSKLFEAADVASKVDSKLRVRAFTGCDLESSQPVNSAYIEKGAPSTF